MAGSLGRPWRTRSIRVSQACAWFYVKFPTGAYHSRRSYREGCDCVMGHTVHQSAPKMRYGIKQGDYHWWRRAKPPNTSSTTTHLDLSIVSHWTACRYVSAFWCPTYQRFSLFLILVHSVGICTCECFLLKSAVCFYIGCGTIPSITTRLERWL
jgi:hypothetical protein